jgi:hypothetical protein
MDGALILFFSLFFDFCKRAWILDFLWSFTSERISGRHALRNFSKDNTYDLAVFALLVSLPAGLHVLGIRERERIDIFFCAASLAVLAHCLHFFRAFVRLEICSRYDL